MSDVITYKRGQVWMMKDDIPDKYSSLTSVQRGTRPALIFSNDLGNKTNDTLIVFKITSKDNKGNLSVNVRYYNDKDVPNVVLCNQISTISKSDLTEYMYTISDDIMKKVEEAHKLATDTCSTDIDKKIDDIYTLLEDLSVIKSNQLHDTTKDEEVIRETADEIKKIYANLVKYHDSTVEELKKSIYAINDDNAKIRMGLPRSVGTGQEKELDTTDIKEKDLKQHKSDKTTSHKRHVPYGYWTRERMQELVHDKETLSVDEYLAKYNKYNRATAMNMYYRFKAKLEEGI